VVVVQEDIETAFEIPEGIMISYAKDFTQSMAAVESDYLVETFSENHLPGPLVEVHYSDSLVVLEGHATEHVLELDTPFSYNGVDNLLIDICYSDSTAWCGNYGWQDGTARCVYDLFYSGGSGNPTGQSSGWIPYMVLQGMSDLRPSTAGASKAIPGYPGWY